MQKIIHRAIVFITILALPLSVSAMTVSSGTTVNQAGDVGDVFAVGGTTVNLNGMLGNDVYAAGNSVTVSGPVAGDLTVGAGTVTVTGDIAGGVRVLGGTVSIDSKVGGNVLVAGGTLTIDSNADIAGEVIIAGSDVIINGHVVGPVNAVAGIVTINGTIDKSVSLRLGGDGTDAAELVLQQQAVLNGDLTYWAAHEAIVDAGASVAGATQYHETEVITYDFDSAIQRIIDIGRLWNLFSALVVGLLVALLFPKTLRNVADTMLKRSGASIGWGALVALALPLAFIILLMTVIGIPLGFLSLGLYLATFYLVQVFFGFFVGSLILRWLGKRRPSQDGTPAPKQIAPVWLTLLGIIIASLVLDFLFGYLGSVSAILSFFLGIIVLFLKLWTFGAIILVIGGYIRDRELR